MSKLKDCKSDKEIWLLGGAQLVQSFTQESLIDEIILTIVPHTLRAGVLLGLTFESFNLHVNYTFPQQLNGEDVQVKTVRAAEAEMMQRRILLNIKEGQIRHWRWRNSHSVFL